MPYPAILHDHVRHIATPVTLVFETRRLVLVAPDAPRLFLDARAICNVDCTGATMDDQPQMISGTYEDTFERRDGTWKITAIRFDLEES